MEQVFAADVVIARPRREVWAALTDWDRARHWMDGVDRLSADGPVATGTALTFTTNGRDRTSSILDATEEESLTIRSQLRGITADYAYGLEDVDGGTRVTLVATVATNGVQRLLGPVYKEAMRRTDSGQLDRLRAVLEG